MSRQIQTPRQAISWLPARIVLLHRMHQSEIFSKEAQVCVMSITIGHIQDTLDTIFALSTTASGT